MDEFRRSIEYALYSQSFFSYLPPQSTSADVVDSLYMEESLATSLIAPKGSVHSSTQIPNVLSQPDLLWTEDIWTKERVMEADLRLRLQGEGKMTSFLKDRYQNKASTFWHEFYKRNTDNFYKDRHYLHIVFPELSPEYSEYSSQRLQLLEVGSGVGNAILPLLEINPNLSVTAIDFAKSAIEILSRNDIFQREHCKGRIQGYVCNAAKDDLPVDDSSMNFVLCMFVLSAMPPEDHARVIKKLSLALQPGGKLLIRDYGRYDEAQLRFKKDNRIAENFYVRQDGTCAYFFSSEELRAICIEAGLVEEENDYILRQYANRKQGQARYRVWIHAKFVKPI